MGTPDPLLSPCVSSGTLSAAEDDSEGEALYSTEWDTSSAEEDSVSRLGAGGLVGRLGAGCLVGRLGAI